jgi:hypothetical protein
MKCQSCERELSKDEPVYRVRGRWQAFAFNSSFGSVCAKCEAEKYTHTYVLNGVERVSRNYWLTAKPCSHCQRPVIVERHRRGLHFFVCGTECRQAMYANTRRRTPKKATCVVCKKRFLPPRADAEYCSNACRQRAYRLRLGVARIPRKVKFRTSGRL